MKKMKKEPLSKRPGSLHVGMALGYYTSAHRFVRIVS